MALQSLNLSNNAIQRLESIPQSLKFLDASHNLLRRISGLEKHHSLTSVNFSHNSISRLSGTNLATYNRPPTHTLSSW